MSRPHPVLFAHQQHSSHFLTTPCLSSTSSFLETTGPTGAGARISSYLATLTPMLLLLVATTGVSRHYAVRPPIRHPIYRTAKSARRPTKRAVQPVFPSLAAEGQGRGAARVRPQHLIQTDVSGRGTATRFAAVFNATPDGRAQDALSVLIPHASVALMIGEEPVFSSPSEPTLTEGFYLLLAVKLWKDDARHGDLILISDNQRAINLLSADQRNVPYTFAGEITPKLVRTLNVLRTIGREILDIAVIADINVRYQWVPRRENSLANSLARWDLVGHRVLFHPNMWAKMESTRKRLAEMELTGIVYTEEEGTPTFPEAEVPLGFAARATAERWKTKLLIDNPSQAADMLFAALLDKLKNANRVMVPGTGKATPRYTRMMSDLLQQGSVVRISAFKHTKLDSPGVPAPSDVRISAQVLAGWKASLLRQS
ncbi:uncharacterized protein MKK02DRAFT_41666 [Dioszegia hungarica]|uniref:Uncharacterized protein n=1 Tax=Dioszegia hungarica TaxID=4972 RepID=A0AA38LS16_9TREE|nr:uncharacterized protein MKK02DRAFT_41666 [Dioszegia hungarica]KAI9632024.1 hypothetical protein MKK02DRAFT_41666 [Dioszegia hungarica]